MTFRPPPSAYAKTVAGDAGSGATQRAAQPVPVRVLNYISPKGVKFSGRAVCNSDWKNGKIKSKDAVQQMRVEVLAKLDETSAEIERAPLSDHSISKPVKVDLARYLQLRRDCVRAIIDGIEGQDGRKLLESRTLNMEVMAQWPAMQKAMESAWHE